MSDGFSYPKIIALAQKSGLPNNPGSTYRPGDPKYHGRGWAVDFMGFNQDALTQYFMKFDTLEIIHWSETTGKQYGTSHNQAWAPGSNQELFGEHKNHLHVAMTPEQADAALGGATVSPDAAAGGGNGGLGGPASVITAFAAIPRFLMNADNRKRIAYFLVGILLVFIGLAKFNSKVSSGIVKTASALGGPASTKAVKKVVGSSANG